MVNISNMSKAYSEVYAFLNVVGEEYINKIPTKIYNIIKNKKDINYNPVYNKNQTMTKDMISKEALALIAALNLEYWCDNEKEKQNLKQCYINNFQKEEQKYRYENLFKKESIEEVCEEKALIEYEEEKNIFLRLIKRIKDWWKKKI